MIEQIFVDMDGVLVDFVSTAMQVNGGQYDAASWPAKEWSIAKVLGITEEAFWKAIDEWGRDFWEHLAEHSWAGGLLEACSTISASVAILSSPSRSPDCHAGKKAWMDRHCPDYKLILCDSSQKHLLARPGRLLIDDNDDNVRRWREAGGKAILFPQPWNTYHEIGRAGHGYEQVLLDMRRLEFAAAQAPAAAAREKQYRKDRPLVTGVLDYFPDALLEVAATSKAGNDQHNPGQPLHWDKSKSTDEADALGRHLLERGRRDTDGIRHSAKVAWRALAMLQRELDAEK